MTYVHFQGYRSWVPADVKALAKLKESFKLDEKGEKTQLRAYPADPNCAHNVSGGKCFCTDKCADHMNACVEEWAEDCPDNDGAEWVSTDQAAPFHKSVVDVAKKCTFSTVADPLCKNIPQKRRTAGIWHCVHNCRTAMWILLKDMAAQYDLIEELQRGMASIDMKTIRCAAVERKSKKATGNSDGSVEGILVLEGAEGRRVGAIQAEEKVASRASMDGNELLKVMHSWDKLVAGMEAGGIPEENEHDWNSFKISMKKALASFNAGAAFALMDIWDTDKSQEMGEHFRDWADTIIDEIGPTIGLKYTGRSYLDILPAHWLTEPDHLQAHAHRNYQEWGIAPGGNTDAACEAGKPQYPLPEIILWPTIHSAHPCALQ